MVDEIIPFIRLISTVGRSKQVLPMSLDVPPYNIDMLQ